MDNTSTPMTEDQARELAERAVEEAGGTRAIYGNPRHPFALQPATNYEFDGHRVELRHGEISSPAIVSVGGWVFEIHEEEIELLIRPPKPRPAGSSCR
ncbi:MAG TPA: protein-L-isoaspartate o-methyltransferase 1 [Thermomicrobiales bacterium]